ncbi:MAG TPA: ABC transporter permease [Micromonosporaceae bacterium]|jgi:peptide/nickel transport system permease protein
MRRAALVVLGVVVILAIFGGHLAPYDPLAQNPAIALHGPSFAHPFGTDYLGRDVLSRLVAGTGRSVAGALEAVLAGLLLGVVPGLVSLWSGRAVEWVLLRVVDALMTLPFIVFAIAVTGVVGNGLNQAMLAIGVLFAPMFFRITRAAAIALTGAQYVEAAELFGASRRHILRTHIARKVAPTIAVTAAQASGAALLAVASLTFLGIGVQPPAPTWGGVLAGDLGFLSQQPWAPVIPALLIMATVAALNALADRIRSGSPVLRKGRGDVDLVA